MRRFLALLLAALLLGGCAGGKETAGGESSAEEGVVSGEAELEPEPPKEEILRTATLLAVGDNLIHDVIYEQAQRRARGGGYDFLPVYERVKGELAAADIAFINQESPLAKSFPPASFPLFNTPVQMADDLQTLGFDVVNIANNHMLDKGTQGLYETLALLRTKPYAAIGAYETEQEYDTPAVIVKNGIRFAFMGFTQHTNGLFVPDENAGMIVYTDEMEAARRQITAARGVADVVVVSVHWGEEEMAAPTLYQRGLAQNYADSGADIVIGTHPHVLQPVEYVTGSGGRKTLVLYSLGNFVSAQLSPENLVGAMAHITVEKNETTGKVTVREPLLSFVITQYGPNFSELQLYPLEEYTPALAARHGLSLSGVRFDLELINSVIETAVDSRFRAEVPT